MTANATNNTKNKGFLAVAALGYFVLGMIGTSFAIAPGYASPVFPAAGFAVACLLWSDRKAWPAILVGSFALNLAISLMHQDTGGPATLIAAGIAVGSTFQALAAAWLVERGVGDGWRSLENVSDVVRTLALAGPVACLVSATAGVSILYAAGAIQGAEYVYSWWNWWSGDALGVMVILPLTLTFLFRKSRPWRGRLSTQVIPMAVTLVLVGAAFVAAAHWERSQQKLIIEKYGDSIANLLEQRFAAHQEAIAALTRLIEVTPGMTSDQFRHFARITLRDNPDIFALSINPYVLREYRKSFEQRMATLTGTPDFEIRERDVEKGLVRAADRSEYVSVGYIAPLKGNRPAIGFDINSEPIRRDAIQRAKASGKPAVTAPINLVQENRNRVGVLVLNPAYVPVSDADVAVGKVDLMGFAVGVIKVDEMVEIATQSARVPGLVYSVSDAQAQSAKADQATFYQSETAPAAPDAEYAWQRQLSVADRTWTLRVYPTTGFLRQSHYWMSPAVAIVGLLLSTLLQVLLLVITGNAAVIRRKVDERTTELKRSQLDLVHAQAVSRVGSWRCHVVDNSIECSPETRRLFGVDHSRQVNYPFVRAMVHPDDAEAFDAAWQEMLRGQTSDFMHRIVVDGEVRWLRQRAEMTYDADGRPQTAVGTTQDITAEKVAEIALNNHRILLRSVIDESPDLIMLKDWDGRFLLVNRVLAARYGTTPKDMVGMRAGDFNPDDDRIAFDLREIQATMRSGETVVVDETSTNAVTGEVRYFQSVRKPLRGPSGDPRILIICHDITDLRRAHEAIRENERRYSYAMAAAGDGMWDWDIKRNVVIHNERWCEILGLDTSRVRCTLEEFSERLHEDDAAEVTEAIGKALRGEADYRHEHRMRRANGEVIWVLDRGTVVERDAEGNPLRMVGSVADISIQKHYEDELIEAKIAAESANIAKSRFLATMSHEIRTPMNGILGMAQMMELPDLSESERYDYARVIISSGRSLLALLNDILDLSKVEAGKLTLESVVFEADQIVSETGRLYSEAARTKGVSIDHVWNGLPHPRYLGDPHRIRQILGNLIGNAVKFTSAGSVHVSGCEISRDERTALLEFSVRDTGIGIAREVQGRLFQPFSQGDRSTTRQFGGSGLGLSIVRSLAKLMGGTADVESEEGQGSRFWFRIRVELADGDADFHPAETLMMTEGTRSVAALTTGARILVVDDSLLNRKVMEVFLNRLGISTMYAEDGTFAVEAVTRGTPIDLIIMDLQMPTMDGDVAAREIRKWETENGRPRHPIIAITADAFEETHRRCLDAGMDDFLPKPVSIEALETLLWRWLPQLQVKGQ